jgi:hypothetical protein
MNDDDFLYGCRSGIQKAIRRGDLDLARTAFDTLWKDQKQRSWLKWRMTVLVEEDAWQMIGELAQFLNTVDKEEDEEKAWRRFTYQLVLAPKSKDTEALLYMAMKTKEQTTEHPELEAMRRCLRSSTEPSEAGRALMNRWEADGTWKRLSKYEQDAITLLHRRLGLGGMLLDRKACLSCMILVVSRGLNEKIIKASVELGLKSWVKKNGKRKPRLVNLDWYVFDMHTVVGKMAMSIFMKNKASKFKGLTKEKLDDIWFYLESAIIPDALFRPKKYHQEAKLNAFESMWWPMLLDFDLAFGDNSSAAVRRIWEDTMKQEMHNLVDWCLNKRAQS